MDGAQTNAVIGTIVAFGGIMGYLKKKSVPSLYVLIVAIIIKNDCNFFVHHVNQTVFDFEISASYWFWLSADLINRVICIFLYLYFFVIFNFFCTPDKPDLSFILTQSNVQCYFFVETLSMACLNEFNCCESK